MADSAAGGGNRLLYSIIGVLGVASSEKDERARKSAEASINANVEATKKAAIEARDAMVKAAGEAADAARAAGDAARETWEKNTGSSPK